MHRSLALLPLLFAFGCSSSNEPPPATSEPAPPVGEEPGPKPDETTPPPCSGKAGTFHDQALEARRYWLHVPASYRCEKATALVVDFHGTGFGQEPTDPVEESWATPELTAAADDLGFIVVRPRSRSKAMNGGHVFQWDINGPSDVAANKTFASALVEDLRARYHIDGKRIYATGFSNGPSMAAQFLADEPSIFSGYGLIAGGLNMPLAKTSKFDAGSAPRIYTMTGFRDYMLMAKDLLDAFLVKNAFPKEKLFDREADTGHEVYGWHFREAFEWMDKNVRPNAGTLATGFTKESGVPESESIVEITIGPAGLVAGGTRGSIFARAADGTWTTKASIPSLAPITDLCFQPNGQGFAVGHGRVAKTEDGVTWTVLPQLPEFGPKQFGYTWATTIGCTANRITVGGVWSNATSGDGGQTWTEADLARTFTAAVRPSATGWLAVGYWNWAGRSNDGIKFQGSEMPGATQWWNDVATTSTGAITVGEGGALATTTDGVSWSLGSAPKNEDLYAVASRGSTVVAVGAHGSIIVSKDGGATFSDRSTGLDAFLGAVRFLDDDTILVAGERGTVLRADL